MVQQLHKGKDLILTSTGLQEMAVSMCPVLPFSGRLSLSQPSYWTRTSSIQLYGKQWQQQQKPKRFNSRYFQVKRTKFMLLKKEGRLWHTELPHSTVSPGLSRGKRPLLSLTACPKHSWPETSGCYLKMGSRSGCRRSSLFKDPWFRAPKMVLSKVSEENSFGSYKRKTVSNAEFFKHMNKYKQT